MTLTYPVDRSDRYFGCKTGSKRCFSGGNPPGHGLTSSSGHSYVSHTGIGIPSRLVRSDATAFQPRILLLVPFVSLLLLLLHRHEQSHPSIRSVLGAPLPPAPPLGTVRLGSVPETETGAALAGHVGESTDLRHSASYTTTTTTAGATAQTNGTANRASTDGDEVVVPAVPPREAESGIDYYMNVQAIQNTMGWM